MTLNISHVYSCKWEREQDWTFFNVLDSVDTSVEEGVHGRCVGKSFRSGQFEPCNDEEYDWEYDSWIDPNNIIIDLGPYETFYSNNPELFL